MLNSKARLGLSMIFLLSPEQKPPYILPRSITHKTRTIRCIEIHLSQPNEFNQDQQLCEISFGRNLCRCRFLLLFSQTIEQELSCA